jgi:hypothetical protein
MRNSATVQYQRSNSSGGSPGSSPGRSVTLPTGPPSGTYLVCSMTSIASAAPSTTTGSTPSTVMP